MQPEELERLSGSFLEFVKWYSGMNEDQIKRAWVRYNNIDSREAKKNNRIAIVGAGLIGFDIHKFAQGFDGSVVSNPEGKSIEDLYGYKRPDPEVFKLTAEHLIPMPDLKDGKMNRRERRANDRKLGIKKK